MQFQQHEKQSFIVIGKEGATSDGSGFIEKLWADANARFDEVRHLAKTDADGGLCGVWGAMSDFSRAFKPWEDFDKGLYLAGVECVDGAEPPAGWTKWTIPGYVYLCTEQAEGAFMRAIAYMRDNGLPLVGAAHDFTCPRTGKSYIFLPIRKL